MESWQKHLDRGAEHFRNQSFDAAILEFEAALRLNPEDQDSAVNLSALYILNNRQREAETLLEKLLARFEENPLLHFNLAKIRLSKGQLDSAAVSLQRAAHLDPANLTITKNLGFLAFEKGDFIAARRIFQSLKKGLAGDPDIPYFLGRLNLSEGDLEGANREFTAAYRLRHAHFQNLYFWSLTLFRLEQHKKALLHVRQARLMSPQDLPAHRLFIEILLATGEIESAKRELLHLKSRDQSEATRKLEALAVEKLKSEIYTIPGIFIENIEIQNLGGVEGHPEKPPAELFPFYERGDFLGAISHLRGRPTSPEGWSTALETACLLKLSGFTREAAKLFHHAEASTRSNPRYLFHYLHARWVNGEELEPLISDNRSHFPDHARTLPFFQAIQFLRAGEFAPATDRLHTSEPSPLVGLDWLETAVALHFLNRTPDHGVALIDQWRRRDPRNLRLFHLGGTLLALARKFPELDLYLESYRALFETTIPFQDLQALLAVATGREVTNHERLMALSREPEKLNPRDAILLLRWFPFAKETMRLNNFERIIEKNFAGNSEIQFALYNLHFIHSRSGKFFKFFTQFWNQPLACFPWEMVPFIRAALNLGKLKDLAHEYHLYIKIHPELDPARRKAMGAMAWILTA